MGHGGVGNASIVIRKTVRNHRSVRVSVRNRNKIEETEETKEALWDQITKERP